MKQDKKTRAKVEVDGRSAVRREYAPPTITSAAIDRVVRQGGSVRRDSTAGTLSLG